MARLPKIRADIAKTVGATPKLREKEVFDEIRKLGLTIKKTDYGEYRVGFKGKMTEDSSYYTDDLRDALDTAKAMLRDRNVN